MSHHEANHAAQHHQQQLHDHAADRGLSQLSPRLAAGLAAGTCVAGLGLGLLPGAPAVRAQAPAPAQLRCSLADERIDESSGVASASWSDDVLFTHNDSGDGARFFAIDARTCATRATYTVKGATSRDWEDMARATAADGTPVLWLADIGDNDARRSSILLYEVAEPGAAGGDLPIRTRLELTYPDGPRDAESVLVDPETGRIVVVSKDRIDGRSRAYRVPAEGSGALEPLASLDVKALPGGGLASLAWSVTSGDTSPDRRRVVLRSYLAAWVWAAAPGESLKAVLSRAPTSLDPPLTGQAEAIAFSRDGGGLWVTSEGASTPVHLLPLVPAAAAEPGATTPSTFRTATPTSEAAAAEAGSPAEEGRPRVGLVALAGGAAVVLAAAAVLVARRLRR